MNYRKLIADDQSLITYRPALREIGGSVAGTVLLQQIMYWDDKSSGKFYKFSEPCKHKAYKEGDSWDEELGMSAKELRTALKHFAFKCGKKNKDKLGAEYESKRKSALVQYYTDSKRVTWYMLNRNVLNKLLVGIYKESDQAAVTSYTETTQRLHTDIAPNVAERAFENKQTNSTASPLLPKKDNVCSDFERCWVLYKRKGVKAKALRYWKKLNAEDRAAIEAKIPAYVASNDLCYLKNFEGWINPTNRQWEDVVVSKASSNGYGAPKLQGGADYFV